MEKLLEFLVIEITGQAPQAIESHTDDGLTTYIVIVAKEHMGLLIGKNGRTIAALRTLARVRGAQEKTKVNIELQEASS